MNEHPVPRNVTGFQFQLIGFMTLKQFGYLVAGALIAFVFYSAPLSFFRFPLAAFFLFVGIAFAFFPIQERPLDVWIVNLIKSVYSPTQFVWQREFIMPELFTMKSATHKTTVKTVEHDADTKTKLATYLASIAPGEEQRLDASRDQTLKKVSDLFSQHIPVKEVNIPPIQPKTNLSPSIGALTSKFFAPRTTPAATTHTSPASIHHTTPTLPKGIVSGLIKTNSSFLSGILIHITNQEGQQVRLLKTNAQGKFATILPLDPGTYHLSIEDPQSRYTFRPFTFEVAEEGLHPWLLMPKEEAH